MEKQILVRPPLNPQYFALILVFLWYLIGTMSYRTGHPPVVTSLAFVLGILNILLSFEKDKFNINFFIKIKVTIIGIWLLLEMVFHYKIVAF